MSGLNNVESGSNDILHLQMTIHAKQQGALSLSNYSGSCSVLRDAAIQLQWKVFMRIAEVYV
jgi:hypothetical protein